MVEEYCFHDKEQRINALRVTEFQSDDWYPTDLGAPKVKVLKTETYVIKT